MDNTVVPINIAAGALIAQFSLLVIMFSAAIILKRGEMYTPAYRRETSYSSLSWIILSLTLITIGFLVFSDEISNVWNPVFGTMQFSGIKWSTSLFMMFTFDISYVSFLVALSGGSQRSPFSPIYFLLPALAIFLREPLSRIIFYLICISLSFSYNLFSPYAHYKIGDDPLSRRLAYFLVSVACFLLAMFIGYLTRPK